MRTRRLKPFLAAVTALLLPASLWAGSLDPDQVIKRETLVPPGTWEEATVLDMLDLAARANLALNYMLRNHDPESSYALYHIFRFDTAPPEKQQLTWNLPIKELRAFPWVRTMTGSSEGLDIEAEMMRAYLQQVSEDGVIYYPFGGEGVPEGTSYAYTQGMTAIAMDNWYQRDGKRQRPDDSPARPVRVPARDDSRSRTPGVRQDQRSRKPD